jgi:hypothetical protein
MGGLLLDTERLQQEAYMLADTDMGFRGIAFGI